jgi:hypothetical protein
MQVPLPAGVSRVRPGVVALGATSAVFVAAATVIEWSRFRVPTPSLIDDWYSIAYSRQAFHALLHGDYGSAPIDFAGRYRPAYAGVWNYVQWHLLGGPSVATAALWGAIRIVLFLTAVWLLCAVLVKTDVRRWRPSLWLAPIAVLMTPAIAVDLARHSPAEPLMVAGLVLGLLLMGVGLRSLLVREDFAAGPIALVAFGFALYLFGVYSKETSVGIVVFAPFVLKTIAPTIRKAVSHSRRNRYLVMLSSLLLIAPLIHLGVHLSSGLANSREAYTHAHSGLGRSVLASGLLPLIGAPGPLGTFVWLVAAPVAVGAAAIAVARREPDGWLLVGVLAAGFTMSGLALARGDTASRYYIPWIVAVAVVAARAMARAPSVLHLLVAVFLATVAVSQTRPELSRWVASEKSGATAVELASGIVRADCPLYLANFDVERRVAIPRLLAFGDPSPVKRCGPGEAFVVNWQATALPSHFATHCHSQWIQVADRDHVAAYRCASYSPDTMPDQDAASGRPGIRTVRLRVPSRTVDPVDLF